jgi:CsoR family transcriptional regulator, copper-sensing transcriptional repressor
MSNKEKIQNRLKTIEGHVRGVQRMLEEDAYCIDILKQTRAIRQALSKLDTLILADHLNHCVTTAIRSDELAERERVVNELLQVFAASERE